MTVTAHCHCGATQIILPETPTEGSVCNCTYCNRTGAVWGYYQQGDVKITAAHDASYSASGGANDHHFCANCGGNTHGFAPDYSGAFREDGSIDRNFKADMTPENKRLQVNLRMIDDFDPASVKITHLNGRNDW